MNAAKRQHIFERLEENDPTPTTELRYKTPFELLVAVVLSAQSTDRGVNRATRQLFKIANTPAQLAELGVAGLKPYISSIGLYNVKARNLIKIAQEIQTRFHGEIPSDRRLLESLPGIGRKTANVILNTAFGLPTIAVDTHVFRVANRTGLAKGATPREVEKRLVKVVPERYKKNAHHWLVLHGRYVCKARKPDCSHCLILDLCEYKQKNIRSDRL